MRGGGLRRTEAIEIGDLRIEPPLVLGPMAGTTNRAFRLLCRRGGAGLVCSEMVSANALSYGSSKTERLLRTFEGERPVSIQVFGAEPEIMAAAVPTAEAAGADTIDVNMGCAVPKVRKAGAGVALMSDPERAVAVTEAVVRRAHVPVTVKLRAGLNGEDDSYVELAQRLAEAGAAAIAVHARTGSQSFSDRADWRRIKRVREAVGVPVIGSGDVFAPEDAAAMLEQTGCAGVMIARGAWGRPWIFGQAAAVIAGRPVPPDPPPQQRLGIALLHAQMLADDLGMRVALHQMTGQIRHYTRDMPSARVLRAAMSEAATLAELRQAIEQYCRSLERRG